MGWTASAAATAQDPHAGHTAAASPSADPHAGHTMMMGQDGCSPNASMSMQGEMQDPHAGHAMTAEPAQDPHAGHAGHQMSIGQGAQTIVVGLLPDIRTAADVPGRPQPLPAPPEALAGPVHAADAVFGADAMRQARAALYRETGPMRTTALFAHRLEATRADGETGYGWDVQGWTGGDINRLWLKTEGAGGDDGVEHGDVQLLYSRAVTPFWNLQAGVRQDFGEVSDATHLALGVQGLAPYWWETDATLFVSTDGDVTARMEAEYDQRITQHWIVQPRVEVGLSAQDSDALDIGSGLTSIEAGLRLRYEIRREFAPYIGVSWERSFGGTADRIVAHGGDPDQVLAVVGLSVWF